MPPETVHTFENIYIKTQARLKNAQNDLDVSILIVSRQKVGRRGCM